jgi:hypothetical protein
MTLTRNAPDTLSVPAYTLPSFAAETGSVSPVTRLWSISDRPSMITPSTAMRSPGRTRTRSPGSTDAAGTSASSVSLTNFVRVSARGAAKFPAAAPVYRRIACSSVRPTSSKVRSINAKSK